MRTRHPDPIAASLAALLLACAISSVARADDWPTLEPGLWEFKRSVVGSAGKQHTTLRRCADPIAELRSQNQKMSKAGCTLSPLLRSGNVYRFSVDCAVQSVKAHSETELTVESRDAYSLRVSTAGMMTSVDTLYARRTGACAR